MKRRPADVLIGLGFWMQLVLLVLVDWGSLVAFREKAPPWYHVVGFVTVNVVLCAAWIWAFMLWRRGGPRRGAKPPAP